MQMIRRIARLMIYGSFSALLACNVGGGTEDANPLVDASGNGSGQFTLDVQPNVSPRQLEATGPTTSVDLGTATTLNGTTPVTITATITGSITETNAPVTNGAALMRNLPVGTTSVTWTATDGAGLVLTETRMVVIADRTAPRFDLTNTSLIYIQSLAGQSAANVDLGWVTNVVDATPATAITVSITEVDAAGNPVGGFVFPPVGTAFVSPAATVVIPTVTFGIHYFKWTLTDSGAQAATQIQQVVVSNSIVLVAPQNLTVAQGTAIVVPALPINNTPVKRTMTVTSAMLGTATAAGGFGGYNFRNDAPNPAVGNLIDANNAGNSWTLDVGTTATPTTTVTWSVFDSFIPANTATAMQTVEVVDNTPPTISVPSDVTFVSLDGNPVPYANVPLGTATAVDNVDGQGSIVPMVVAPPASFPFNQTTVLTWQATDSSGNVTTGTQNVTITPPAVKCSTLVSEFQNKTYPTMSLDADLVTPSDNTCRGCHTPGGARGRVNTANNFYLDGVDAAADFAKFKQIANITNGAGISLLKTKPLGGVIGQGHRSIYTVGSTAEMAISSMADKAIACVADTINTQGVDIGSYYQRLRKATLALASRLPTTGEEASIVGVADEAAFNLALDAVLTNIMNTEAAFYDRLKEIYNDVLLTDKFATSTREPTRFFDLDNFANETFFDDGNNDANSEQLGANYGIAKAPLELIANVVRTDQPFTDIVTANYVMVNPYSATLYSANVGGGFNYPASADMNDFRQASLSSDVGGNVIANTHAGILSTLVYLTRYPSTNTNINRERTNAVMRIFLGVDAEGFAARDGLDLDNIIGSVPTYEDPQCTVCHDNVDPIAGLMKNWNNSGQFRGDYTNWYNNRTTNGVPRMLNPGYDFQTATIPADSTAAAARSADSIRYLGERIAGDSKFAKRTVGIMFTGLTGYNTDPTYTSQFPNLDSFLTTTSNNFASGGFDMKQLVKDIVMSIYFRAENLSTTADPNSFTDLGMGRLLIPEQLNRNLQNVLSYNWTGPRTNDSLLNPATYMLMYGGIDSDNVITRSTEINRLMVGIQDRIANQTACARVATDLINTGTLFPYASLTDTPATNPANILANVQHLHKILLGEVLGPTDPKILATNQLFVDVRNALMTATDNAIPGVCRGGGGSTDTNYTVKPWMAVVAYLLSDYEFLYE